MKITVPARTNYFSVLKEFIRGYVAVSAKEQGLPEIASDAMNDIFVVSDEIFSNIVKYSNMPVDEHITIALMLIPGKISLEFRDSGREFNPLKYKIPITQQPRSCKNGVLMITNMMDKCYYEFKDGQNIFTVCKNV